MNNIIRIQLSKDFLKKARDYRKLLEKILQERMLEFEDQKKKVPSGKLRFNSGVLFRDFCDRVLIIDGENTLEYRLLKFAMEHPVGKRIDQATEDLDMRGRQIYDTAGRLNDKIEKIFEIEDFFQRDSKNKHVKRTVD